MTILTERERERAKFLVQGGHSYNEAAEAIFTSRGVVLLRPMADEIAALFGRKLHPLKGITPDEDPKDTRPTGWH